MPELPEVQNVCLSLAPRVLGRRVVEVQLRRPEIVRGSATPAGLLEGQTLTAIQRHGKHLALIGSACLDIHLGMTGSLCHSVSPDFYVGRDPVGAAGAKKSSHIHVAWRLDDGSWLLFRDPRRFGGIWTFASITDLQAQRWHALGQDALTIPPADLAQQLAKSHRPIKAALLDQGLIAGLGNIYVDELLFACGLHPLTPTDTLAPAVIGPMVRAMRRILQRAIIAGGSSTRDYVNAEGQAGAFQRQHKVYGRGGQPCRTCHTNLKTTVIAGRTSAFCPTCQPAPRRSRSKRRRSKRRRPKLNGIVQSG